MKHAHAKITITTWHKNPKTNPTARRMGASASARMRLAADAMTFDLLPKTNMQSLKIKLDVTKLDKSAFFKGEKGTYCDLILWANDEPDQWGNTHSVKQDMGKDRKGEKTPYVGNAKPIGQAKPSQRQAPVQSHDVDDDSDVPF